MARQKIAILGGGPAGLSTAFHLTRDPDWEKKYEITVYQLGWRLGGKGATGRDAGKHHRIEEHGIHGFCRFYFNTWRMMADVYRELDARDRALLPTDTMETTFLPSSLAYRVESIGGCWSDGVDHLPRRKGQPWEGEPIGLDWKDVALGLLQEMARRNRPRVEQSYRDLLPADPKDLTPGQRDTLVPAARRLQEWIRETRERVREVPSSAPRELLFTELERAFQAIDELQRHIGTLMDAALRLSSPRRALTTLDLYLALLWGIVKNALWNKDIDVIDPHDYRKWLKDHGASPETLNSSAVLSVANILFAFPEGDSTGPPWLSAASWMNWMLRSVVGRGEYFYFLASGTGESVILPLYLHLRRLGVHFELFHKLMAVESDTDAKGSAVVETLRFERQASLKNVSGTYNPYVRVPGKSFVAWPNQPHWNLLAHGTENQNLGVDYESWDPVRPKGWKPRTLKRGTHFDYVVWALPPSMIAEVGDPDLCKEWEPVRKFVTTTATQAIQLWLTQDTKSLGWSKKKGHERYSCASFPNPLNGMVVFDDLLGFEAWPKDGPRGLIYLCSQIHVLSGDREREVIRTRTATSALLRLLANFLPGARPAKKMNRVDPQSIDFGLLYDPDPDHTGEERLEYQFARANVRPTEAYAQAPPNNRKGRMDPWKSGYANLVPAGDWIYTGFNLGSFESAVTGGKLAAFALGGHLPLESIEGYGFLHPDAIERASRALAKKIIPLVK